VGIGGAGPSLCRLSALRDDSGMPELAGHHNRGERRSLDRVGFELEFDEDFTTEALDPRRWIAHHLPHWTTPERSAARYDLRPGLLRLVPAG
jgi:hypothetical protein